MNPTPQYGSLAKVLERALAQAESGKGKERHGTADPFEQQSICRIGHTLGSNHFELGQAIKKAEESVRLPRDRAVAELLGAINYLAAAVLVLEARPTILELRWERMHGTCTHCLAKGVDTWVLRPGHPRGAVCQACRDLVFAESEQ